jgi:Tol biopolymer transport system component
MNRITGYFFALTAIPLIFGMSAGCKKKEEKTITATGWPVGLQGTIAYNDEYGTNPTGDIFTFDSLGEKFLHHSGGGEIGDIKWSPDKEKMAFSEAGKMYIIDSDGNNVKLIKADSNKVYDNLEWSPDGKQIAVTAWSRVPWMASLEIFVMNADATGMYLLTKGELLAWSPDGSSILFFDSGTWSIDLSTQTTTRQPDFDGGNYLDISPDGTRVIFTSGSAIFTENMDGSSRRQLTNPDPDYTHECFWTPCWSPDGTKIAYWWIPECDGRPVLSYLCIINEDGSNRIIIAKAHTGVNSDWK